MFQNIIATEVQWSDFFKMCEDSFSLANVTQYAISVAAETILLAVLIRVYKGLNDWKPGRKKEMIYWLLFVPLIFGFLLSVTFIVKNSAINTPSMARPDLKAEINSIVLGQYPPSKDIYVEVQMQVFNAGDAPSFIRGFHMEVIGADKQVFYPFVVASFGTSAPPLSPLPTYSGPVPVLPGTLEGAQSVMDDNLVKKGMNPIPYGGMIEGFLVFTLPNSDLDYLRQNGTIFNVTFSDVKGKIISVSGTAPVTAPNSPIQPIILNPATQPSPTPDKSDTLPKPALSAYP
jgi:hypothetical protein